MIGLPSDRNLPRPGTHAYDEVMDSIVYGAQDDTEERGDRPEPAGAEQWPRASVREFVQARYGVEWPTKNGDDDSEEQQGAPQEPGDSRVVSTTTAEEPADELTPEDPEWGTRYLKLRDEARDIVTQAAGWTTPPDYADPYVIEMACKLATSRVGTAIATLLPNGYRDR